ncbi:MAG TPA: tRNA (adenosine(37)-N6)-threonylcarbamoyltransferase complex dimerization subunit type 1 TsaB [Leptospiraceae bacterium]|nr:tRNA (adenosine(37)-N6)-threonylcarbamoyltransferase complex dimerization subunit type 1 TsaB [Leptospiraceae bacterium]
MKLLYLDTSTSFMVIGLYEISSEVSTVDILKKNAPRDAGQNLVPLTGQLLEKNGWEKPDLISAALGPGSFTGIRTAVSAARDFSQVWKIPLFGFDTLEVYCRYFSEKFSTDIVALLDGKMKKAFAGSVIQGIYSGTKDIPPENLEAEFKMTENMKIATDMNLPVSHVSLYDDFPDASAVLRHRREELLSFPREPNYEKVFPVYLRTTYAEGKFI